MKPKYRVLLTTCDRYLPALKPMAWLMDKYWQPAPDVLVAGFTPPDFDLPANWTFQSIGPQGDYPFGRWSDALIRLLHLVPDDVFLLMLEDMWPVRQVDADALNILYDYMLQFQYVAKMDVCADRLYAMGMTDYGRVGRLDLIQSMPGSPYHLSLMPGFWRKKHLLDVLIPNESPHQVEIIGTPRLSFKQDVIVLGTRSWPLRVTLALRGGDVSKLLLGEVDAEDQRAMRELGYFKPWEG
ncbi:MAG: hypothetical protein EHM35_00030 [Planctomycetaceae bacterium]|nr:MAG: hypothetical protein EHM35_00030 [Planctomycetaceae bacterium]